MSRSDADFTSAQLSEEIKDLNYFSCWSFQLRFPAFVFQKTSHDFEKCCSVAVFSLLELFSFILTIFTLTLITGIPIMFSLYNEDMMGYDGPVQMQLNYS